MRPRAGAMRDCALSQQAKENGRQLALSPLAFVVPGWSERPDPESRDSGFGAAHRPGMTTLSSARLAEQLVDIVPVDEMIDERLQVIRTAVAIVDVVGVLPDIAAEDRGGAMHQRILAVRRLGDGEFATLHLEPAPAGAELTDAGRGEIGLELLQTAEVLIDFILQTARQFAAAAVRLHPAPEVDVVIVLAGIVEDGRVLAKGALHDLLEGLAFEFGSLDR